MGLIGKREFLAFWHFSDKWLCSNFLRHFNCLKNKKRDAGGEKHLLYLNLHLFGVENIFVLR